jgi:hypothetical protein
MKTKPEKQRDLAALEREIRPIWQNNQPAAGPSDQTKDRIRTAIRHAAAQNRQKNHAERASASGNGIFFRWDKIWYATLAAAAAILLLLGTMRVWHLPGTQPDLHAELAELEQDISQELGELEILIWDALAELEHETTSNAGLLQALALQVILWED